MAWMEQLQATNGGQATVCAAGAYVLGCFATAITRSRELGVTSGEGERQHWGAQRELRFGAGRGFFPRSLAMAKGILAVWRRTVSRKRPGGSGDAAWSHLVGAAPSRRKAWRLRWGRCGFTITSPGLFVVIFAGGLVARKHHFNTCSFTFACRSSLVC